jgi:hypothetical protein
LCSLLFIGGVQIWSPFAWDIKDDFHFIKGFDISMATLSIGPSKASTTMSIMVKEQFPHKWQIMPWFVFVPLNTLKYQFFHWHCIDSPNGKNIYSCELKWHCCKTWTLLSLSRIIKYSSWHHFHMMYGFHLYGCSFMTFR